jgi:excisionase family DNA binding protein
MDVLTVTQAAQELGVSTARIRQLIAEKRITATWVNPRLYLIERADLDEYRKSPPSKMGRPRKAAAATPDKERR